MPDCPFRYSVQPRSLTYTFVDENAVLYNFDAIIQNWVSPPGPPTGVLVLTYVPNNTGADEKKFSGAEEPIWPEEEGIRIRDKDLTWECETGTSSSVWMAEVEYDVDDVVRPTTPNGFRYKVVHTTIDWGVDYECRRIQCQMWDDDKKACGAGPNLVGPGGSSGGEKPPAVSALVGEWSGVEDLDGNGLIYGKDFKISDSDPDKPPPLKGIQQQPDWVDPPSEMTWAAYLASI